MDTCRFKLLSSGKSTSLGYLRVSIAIRSAYARRLMPNGYFCHTQALRAIEHVRKSLRGYFHALNRTTLLFYWTRGVNSLTRRPWLLFLRADFRVLNQLCLLLVVRTGLTTRFMNKLTEYGHFLSLSFLIKLSAFYWWSSCIVHNRLPLVAATTTSRFTN